MMRKAETVKKRTCILVLGMHRSGTSALTRVLNIAGAALPKRLMEASDNFNATGHWEPDALIVYHDRLLAELGSSWYDWQALDMSRLSVKRREEIRQEIHEIIAADYGDAPLVVLKDPRICRFAPFFFDILQEGGFEVSPVLPFRNPLEVCESLERRDGMKRADAALLWLRHVLDAEKATRGHKRTIISYNSLLKDWKAVLEKISGQLEPNDLHAADEIASQVKEFLSPTHRHHARKTEDILLDPVLRDWAGEAYEALLVLARNPKSAKAMARLDVVRAEFNHASPVLHRLYDEVRTEREGEVGDLRTSLSEVENKAVELSAVLSEKEGIAAELQNIVVERDAQAESLREAATKAEGKTEDLVKALSKSDEKISALKASLKGEEKKAKNLEKRLAQAQGEASQLEATLEQRSAEFAEPKKQISEQEAQTKDLKKTLEKSEGKAAEIAAMLAKREEEAASLKAELSEREKQRQELEEAFAQEKAILSQTLQEKETALEVEQGKAQGFETELATTSQELHQSKEGIANAKAETEDYRNSTSWKLTKPLRAIGKSVRSLKKKPSQIANAARTIKRGIKMAGGLAPTIAKTRKILRYEGILGLKRRWGYAEETKRGYVDFTSVEEEQQISFGKDYQLFTSDFVARSTDTALQQPSVKAIAFYLPQYHPIPENNEWWGLNFTEWSNVVPAQPQFGGHYQPQLPGELGFYDLRASDVLPRQIELASMYGVSGFCFYFYWFAGKTLLETPIRSYLQRKDLDFPFCLCWANENWTRRWDGLENDILIAQDHSPEDDIEFIRYISEYLRDDRYIHINGRPLLIVYRPQLLPDAKETARRWRQWFKKNGLGEIYLAYTQSFEDVDPAEYGFDAAIEFPPNNTAISNVTSSVEGKVDGFDGQIYDWRDLVERSRNYSASPYILHRSVCPSWDNTARKGKSASILINSSPQLYKEWLTNAVDDTLTNSNEEDERVVFINAWNEWAEGAHLEPDKRYGYAFLNATRTALENRNTNRTEKRKTENSQLAIIIHAYYLDVFADLLKRVHASSVDSHLFVTTTYDKQDAVRGLLESYNFQFYLLACDNRGRDILPFLKIVRVALGYGYKFALKLHTKKSKHRVDGDQWRNELYDELLLPSNIQNAIETLFNENDIGMIAPSNHVLSFRSFWGSNKESVMELADIMGLSSESISDMSFIAGSMFYFSMAALMPLFDVRLNDFDFQDEHGQLDGTLAHAIERAFSISCAASGRKIVTTDVLENTNIEIKPIKQYKFASTT